MVASSLTAPVTRLLVAWGQGDKQALEHLTPLVYKELRRLAQWHMNRERPGHTLQATALVNEAYLRLVDINQIQWHDRAHFFAMAARQMPDSDRRCAQAQKSQTRWSCADRIAG